MTAPTGTAAAKTPRLRRRMACFIYEGVLLFGVVVTTALVYGMLTQQRHALVGSFGLQTLIFVVLGLYFVFFWTRSGQTLAMLTWGVKLQTTAGNTVSVWRALCRYLLSWVWFVPALAIVHFSGLQGGWISFGVLSLGVIVYAALSWLHPQRQFWHDWLCNTRLVERDKPRKANPAVPVQG